MLKITLHDATGQPCLELEGRLAGAWVCELEHCWHSARASHPNRTLAVDLTGVTFIDQAGRYLLQLMHRDGVGLVGSGLMLQDILAHIRGSMA
jgi:anti-anti-sigma regulatory factor